MKYAALRTNEIKDSIAQKRNTVRMNWKEQKMIQTGNGDYNAVMATESRETASEILRSRGGSRRIRVLSSQATLSH